MPVVNKRFVLCVTACALLAGGGHARASTALVGNVHATELRVAYSSAAWTTVWSSFRVAEPGPFAVIVPLPDGAYVDQSTDAFFESLDVATAPRVFPPDGLNPSCPGESGPPNPFEIITSTGHVDSLSPQAIALLDDTTQVTAWATSQGLTLEAPLEAALSTIGAKRFLAVRFTSPGPTATTPTLRVSAPTGLPALPFSITRAGSEDLRVTSFFLGAGRGTFDATTSVPVPTASVSWNAKTSTSDYTLVRDELLAAAPDGTTLESASHDSLLTSVPIANDTASIDPVALDYYTRAATYGAAPSDVSTCIADAKSALATDKLLGPVCPRGDLGAPPGTCTPAPPAPSELDSQALLCGPGADDLAIALSGSVLKDAWLTRRTFVITQGAFGKDRLVAFGPAPAVQPIVEASNIDVADCFGSGGGGAGGSTTTTNTNTTGGSHQGGSGTGATGFGASGFGGSYGGESSAGGDTYVYIDPGGCDCNGTVDTTTDSAPPSDDCSGDTSSTATSGDSCSSDTGSTAPTDDCGGDTGTSSDACSGDSAGTSDSCSGDSAGTTSDCAVSHLPPLSNRPQFGPERRRVGPRLSILTLAALAVILPLRRRGTKKKRTAHS